MSTEAARLVDELTTLLYEPCLGKCLTHGPDCRIAVCGACRRKADRAESVVHESDCPVYRLHRAEEANTAVIRANAEEIADLEDARDELEARVNAVVVEIEHERKMFAALTDASVRRIDRLTAERDAALARAEADRAALQACVGAITLARDGIRALYDVNGWLYSDLMKYREPIRGVNIALTDALESAALAAAAPGEGEA